MSRNKTINPVPIISLGILMFIGLLIEAFVHMPHTAHTVFETLWIGTFVGLIILSIVLDTRQPRPEVKASRNVPEMTENLTQDSAPLWDAKTMTEIFRKYHKKNQ